MQCIKHLDEKTFVPLYKTMARSQLDYGCVIWNPYKEKYNEEIEKVQRRATKTLPKLNKLEYIDRLKKLKLPCLKYRRLRGDLIEAYKILRGSYDNNVLKNILITELDILREVISLCYKLSHIKPDLGKIILIFVLQIFGIIYLNMWWRQ